jgi:PKD repeat protein
VGSCSACAVACLLWAGVANAAAGFIPAETLPAGGSADFGVKTAMAPNGFAIAGWVETVDGTHTAIRVATRPPGGGWSAPQQFDVTSLFQLRYPLSVAIDSPGDAVIAWNDEQFGSPAVDTAVVATKSAAQSSFGAAQSFTGAADPVVGIDGAGKATMIDGELDGASHDLVDRVWPAGAAAPVTRTDLVASGCRPDRAQSALAVAPSGNAIAGAQCGGDTFIRRISGTWKSPSQPIADSSSGGCPIASSTSSQGQTMTVAIDASGDVTGAFVESSSTTDCFTFLTSTTTTLELVVGTAPGGVTPAGVVDTASSFDITTGTSISGPDIAIVPGQILLAWDTGGFISTNVQVRQFDAAGNPLGPAQPLGTSTFIGVVDIALSPTGGALAVFPTSDSTGVQAAARAPGALAFSPPTALAASPSAGPGVAIDDAGDGVAVYDSGHSGSAVAQARGFDATPPSIDSTSIPSAATAGQPVQFAAQASDLWGPVTLSWNFGDGTAAAFGSPAMHAFAAAGTHTVTVTATDAVGNSAQRSGSISVGASSAAPVLSHASIKPKRFKAGHTAVITFTLNRAAGVTIAFARRRLPHRGKGKHAKPRFSRAGELTVPGESGVNQIRFSGRVGKRKLTPGSYRATITAAVGSLKSKPIALSFVMTRRG